MSFNPYDQDMDSFFDFDQSFHNPTSPTSAFAGTIDPSKMMLGSDSNEERKPFAGPSFEYDSFKQLTGIPNGAVSNFTAMNDINSNFSPAMAGPSTSQYSFTPDMNNNVEMDFSFSQQETMPGYFLPTTSNRAGNFIDPLAPSTQEVLIPPTTSRMYPGMHSRQAQQAKSEAIARQQRQQQMGQQIMQERQQQQSMHSQPRHSVSPSTAQPSSASTTDPVVEDRISKILDQMRHNSTASSGDDNDNSPEALRRAKARKEEEDLDEDERLLASEEGKKLSSKERRQLRNKVSARAFRSRRKEYITQLESELAVKATECNELKARNRNLNDQNQQLTRLTQTLLRHPAFSTFLNDMSNDPSILDIPVRTSQRTSPEEYQQPIKQESAPESAHDTQVNFAMMPQSGLDLSMLSLGPTHWNTGSAFSFQQPQVFAVLDLPRGPVFEDQFGLTKLSGKVDMPKLDAASKLDAPKLELPSFPATETIMETPQEQCHFDATGIDNNDPGFALYLDSAAIAPCSSVSAQPRSSLSVSSSPVSDSLTSKSNAITLFVIPPSSSVTDTTATQQINALFDSLVPIQCRLDELIGRPTC